MKYFPRRWLLAVTLAASAVGVNAVENVISDDGREVQLNADGTWDFRSNDRFANTADGRRIRLKSDNTWEYVGNAPLQSKQQFRNVVTDVQLQKVEFLTMRAKAHKNTRKQTQTVFHMQVAHSAAAKAGLEVTAPNLKALEVTDNTGKSYPVLSMHPAQLTLQPGEEQTLEVRADGSPQWWNVKAMQLRIAPEVFGSDQVIELSRSLDEIEKVSVESFD